MRRKKVDPLFLEREENPALSIGDYAGDSDPLSSNKISRGSIIFGTADRLGGPGQYGIVPWPW